MSHRAAGRWPGRAAGGKSGEDGGACKVCPRVRHLPCRARERSIPTAVRKSPRDNLYLICRAGGVRDDEQIGNSRRGRIHSECDWIITTKPKLRLFTTVIFQECSSFARVFRASGLGSFVSYPYRKMGLRRLVGRVLVAKGLRFLSLTAFARQLAEGKLGRSGVRGCRSFQRSLFVSSGSVTNWRFVHSVR